MLTKPTHLQLPRLVASVFCATLLLCQAIAQSQSTSATTKPNIIIVLADDLGYGDLSCLNPAGKIQTPNLDKLAKGGMIFTEAHTSSAVCTPSRYSLLTGRYNWRSKLKEGVLGGFSPALIEEGRSTIAGMLRKQGYATAMIGKWHLGMEWTHKSGFSAEDEKRGRDIDFTKPIGRGPVANGFDEFFGISASLDMPPYAWITNDRVLAQPTKEGSFPWVGVDGKTSHTRPGPVAPDFDAVKVLPELTRKAVAYVERKAPEAKRGQPFFLYLALTAPHTPISPTAEWLGRSGLNPYADFVLETDAILGQLTAALDAQGLSENTLIIFTSDNGCSPAADYPFLTSHGHDPSAARRGYKADIFDGGHRVPFLVKWPRAVAAGSRSQDLVCLVDLMATCAQVVGCELPKDGAEDSISFLPSLTQKTDAAKRDFLVYHSINGSFGIREGDWTLALCPDSGGWSFPRPGKDSTTGMPQYQLFNTSKDSAEATNVYAEHPDIAHRLATHLRALIENGRSTPGPKSQNAPSPKWRQIDWIKNPSL